VIRGVINDMACASGRSNSLRTESTDAEYRLGVAPSTAAGFAGMPFWLDLSDFQRSTSAVN
jgi:hypothetical protein